MKFSTLISTACLALAATAANARVQKQIKNTFPVQGNGKWDYITVGKKNLFVSHGTCVHVLDKSNGKEVSRITELSGVHGIAIDEANAKGYISNGKMNNVVVFDLVTFKVLSTIATEQNPDFIMLDPFSKNIVTGNGKSNSISVIDVTTSALKGNIKIDGKPEAIVSDHAGKLYVNLEDKNAIAVIDITTMKQVATIDISAAGEEPAGLAIDRAQHLAFVGCGNEQLLVVDLAQQKLVNHIKIGAGCDAVTYNAATHTVYASNGEDGTLSVIHEDTPLHFTTVQTLATAVGAKTLALDETTDCLYLPVAHLNGQKDANGKPMFDPESFKVLMVQ